MPHNTNAKANEESYEIPPILPQHLLAWYDDNARALPWREDNDPYRVWISEIMLQQTGAEVVKAYYSRFLDAMPTIEALAAADAEKVLKLWEGLGYYSRARNLMKAAQLIVHEYGGHFPDTYETIIRLPGVGTYTAGAIASICFNERVPAVDGNVVRVIVRIAGIDDAITEQVKKRIADALTKIYPVNRCGDLTQSLMELGAVVCLPNSAPKCAVCPVSDLCSAYKNGTALSLPVKLKKQAKKLQELTVYVLTCGGDIAIRRREGKGVLADMWELPNVYGKLGDSDAVALAALWKTKPEAILKSSECSHVFTHIKWDMICYYIQCKDQPPCFTWVSRQALSDSYSLPTAFKKFVDEPESE